MAGPGSEKGYVNLELGKWTKGRSGNPSGRNKGLVTLIKEAMERDRLEGIPTPDGRIVAEHYAERLIALGMKGNPTAISQVMDRLEGKIGATTEEERQKAANCPVVELPVKDLHPVDGDEDQTAAGTTDSVPGIDS